MDRSSSTIHYISVHLIDVSDQYVIKEITEFSYEPDFLLFPV